MKQIIINADDFGLTDGINRGIVKAYRNGILTSASLLPNGPKFNAAVALARENPDLGIGVHLNILRGRPILGRDKIPSLVDENGCFMQRPGGLLLKSIFHKVGSHEIEDEFRAQIKKVLCAGIYPSHLDTEKHIHTLPFVYKILFNLADEFGIGKVRCLEPGNSPRRLNIHSFIFYLLLLSTKRKRNRMEHKGILKPKYIYGLFDAGKMFQDKYTEIFKHSCGDSIEIVCHPGYSCDIAQNIDLEMGSFYINHSREKELETLLKQDLRKLADSLGIEFISYRGLN